MTQVETDPTAILRSPVVSDDVREQAVRAVENFRPMLSMLTAFARAYSRNQRTRVKMAPTGGTPCTDGHDILLSPPIALGAKVKHDRSVCDRRDERLQLLCPACAIREDVLVVLFHELAHIVHGTFEVVPDWQRAEMMQRAIKESGIKNPQIFIDKIEKMPYNVKTSYIAMSKLISPYLGFIVNALEDARVNAETWKARPGTKRGFDAWVRRIFEEGYHGSDGTYYNWRERPLNLQAMIGLFIRASKFSNTEGWLAPSIEEMLDSQPIQVLLWQFETVRGVQGSYQMALKFLDELREQGFCRTQEEERPEPAPEQPEETEEQNDDTEPEPQDGAGSDEAGLSDSDESSGVGSPDGGDGDADDEGSESDGSPGSEDGDSAEEYDDSSGRSDSGESPEVDSMEPSADEEGDEGSGAPSDDAAEDSAGGEGLPEGESDVGESDADTDAGESEPSEHGDSDSDGSEAGETGAGDGAPSDDMDSADGGGASDSDDASDDQRDVGAGEDGGPDESANDSSGHEQAGAGHPGDGDPGSSEGSDADPGEREDAVDSDPGSADPGEGELEDGEDAADGAADRPGRSGDSEDLSDASSDQDGEADEYEGDPYESAHRGSGDIEGNPLEEVVPDGRSGDQPGDHLEENQLAEDAGGDDAAGESDAPLERGDTLAIDLRDCEYGEPDDIGEALRQFGGHKEDGSVDDGSDPEGYGFDKLAANEVDRAILQGIYFETPSANVASLRVHDYDCHQREDNGTDLSVGWTGKIYWAASRSDMELGRVIEDIPESVLGRALMKTRAVFDDNKRNHRETGKRSGRVNTRSLYKLRVGDDRVFYSKNKPGKKDYFVVIGGDASGSTTGENLQLIKTSMLAQAELCSRVGVDFEVWMHTADAKIDNMGEVSYTLDMYCIKTKDEPWDEKRRQRLHDMYPVSGNLDGHTLEFYRKRADASRATDKIIMYYTDGKMPAANHDEELEVLQREIKTCKTKGYVCMAVGIHTNSPIEHGFDTVQIDSIDEIIRVVEHLDKRLVRKAVA